MANKEVPPPTTGGDARELQLRREGAGAELPAPRHIDPHAQVARLGPVHGPACEERAGSRHPAHSSAVSDRPLRCSFSPSASSTTGVCSSARRASALAAAASASAFAASAAAAAAASFASASSPPSLWAAASVAARPRRACSSSG